MLPLLAIGGAALAGTGVLTGFFAGKGKKDCSTLASERCSKGGVSELWRGEDMDWNCYSRVYNSCISERAAEREGITEKLTAKQKDAIVFGGIGLIALGIIGRHEMLGALK